MVNVGRSYEDHLLTIYKLVKSACANSDQVASVVTKMFSRQLGPIVNTAYNCQITGQRYFYYLYRNLTCNLNVKSQMLYTKCI